MNLKKILLGLLIFAGFIVVFNATVVQAVPPKANLVPSDYDTGISWDKAVKLKKPMVVNFYVDWCGYCKRFAPVLEGLRKSYSSQYTFVLVKADDPANKNIVKKFDISGYPSLYLVNPKNNKKVFVDQNLYSNTSSLKKEFDKFLKNNK